jgi:hypothetical protein
VSAIGSIDVVSPQPDDLAAHWARIIDVPLQRGTDGQQALQFELGAVRFVRAPDGTPERLDALHLDVGDPARVLAAARMHGCPVDEPGGAPGFMLAGVRIVPHPPNPPKASG